MFSCRLYSTVGASLAKVQQQSASIAQFHFPWYLFSIGEMCWWKRSPCSSLTAPQLSGKNTNSREISVFLVTCCSLISGSSAKGCLEVPHSFEPFCFPKILFTAYLKLSPSRLFVALMELVEVFVLDKVSYLWTNENTLQFCLT